MTYIKNKFQYKILYYYSGDLGSKYKRFEKTFVATLVAEKRDLTKRSFEKQIVASKTQTVQSNRKVDAHKIDKRFNVTLHEIFLNPIRHVTAAARNIPFCKQDPCVLHQTSRCVVKKQILLSFYKSKRVA